MWPFKKSQAKAAPEHYLVILGRARELATEESWRRFNALTEINPHPLFGHEQMQDNLMKKWGGSNEEMFEFARTRAAACPGTHVPLIVVRAHLEYAHARAHREDE
ncbi:MAG: hypothetical protein HOV79_16755 [Hamadaea sp.]|nr:hypothetical protein [Hamadaea sp.]